MDYYDLGYRLIKSAWGKGYASECAIASRDYGFNRMQLEVIYAWADAENIASNRVLLKTGFKITGTFQREGALHNWLKISREEWAALR